MSAVGVSTHETHLVRTLDSRVAETVTLTRFATDGTSVALPDNSWDIVIFRRDREVAVLRTGLTTRPDVVSHQAGDEVLVVSFRADAYMPVLPGEMMRDEGVFLDVIGKRDMRVGAHVREIPTFQNADGFVDRLVRDGIVAVNPVVTSILDGRPRAMSERTMQRHFLQTTGLTHKQFTMINRAQEARALLLAGRPAIDVALTLGFSDQAHLINSMRRITGQTPGELTSAGSPHD